MTQRVASLGMYDHPAQHAANDRLWRAIADGLCDRGVAGVPDRLDRTRALADLWRSPDLLFAQTCGYPLTHGAGLPLRVLALPVYDVPGCAPMRHHSVFVARVDDPSATLAAFARRRAAINDAESNTGMNLLRAAVAPLATQGRFFADIIVTGAHRDSGWAVALDRADIAAIDAVTWASLLRFEPGLTDRLRIVGRSAASPALPFVTSDRTDPPTVTALRTVLAQVAHDPALADARASLFLAGIAPATSDSFVAVTDLRHAAERAGYPLLA